MCVIFQNITVMEICKMCMSKHRVFGKKMQISAIFDTCEASIWIYRGHGSSRPNVTGSENAEIMSTYLVTDSTDQSPS
jgi:hypothetical protein